MHGSRISSLYCKDQYNRIARGHVEAGDLQTVRNGAMFWAFDTDPVTRQDRNLSLLSAFKAHAAASGEIMQSLRDLPKYREFVPGIHMPESCDIYSSGFARGVKGDTVTVAVDNARPSDYFRLSEVGVLLDNPDLRKVRRLSPRADGARYSETLYESVPDWIGAQRAQWFAASLERMEVRREISFLAPAENDLLGEMTELRTRFNAAARLHDGTDALRRLDRAQFVQGQDWIRSMQHRPALFHDLQAFLNPG